MYLRCMWRMAPFVSYYREHEVLLDEVHDTLKS